MKSKVLDPLPFSILQALGRAGLGCHPGGSPPGGIGADSWTSALEKAETLPGHLLSSQISPGPGRHQGSERGCSPPPSTPTGPALTSPCLPSLVNTVAPLCCLQPPCARQSLAFSHFVPLTPPWGGATSPLHR